MWCGAEDEIRTRELLREWISHGSQAIGLNDLEPTAVDRTWLPRHALQDRGLGPYIAISVLFVKFGLKLQAMLTAVVYSGVQLMDQLRMLEEMLFFL